MGKSKKMISIEHELDTIHSLLCLMDISGDKIGLGYWLDHVIFLKRRISNDLFIPVLSSNKKPAHEYLRDTLSDEVGSLAKVIFHMEGITLRLADAYQKATRNPEAKLPLKGREVEYEEILKQIKSLGEIISEISDAEAHIKNYLSNQSNIIEEGGGSATARTSKPNTTNKGENTDGKNH